VSALTFVTVWEVFLSQSSKSIAQHFVKCTHCLCLYIVHTACIFLFLAVDFHTVNFQCVLDKSDYINGIINCIKVEVTDFAVDFQMLHFPSCCDLNTEGVRMAYSECEPVLRDTWTKV
jgi:hypothetical protein